MPMPAARAAAGEAMAGPRSVTEPVVDGDLALIGPDHAVGDAHQRRLAGAVLAEQCVHFAGRGLERDIVERGERAEAPGDMPECEQRYIPVGWS